MEWKPVSGFDGYLISRDGRMMSTRRLKDALLKQRLLPNGYLRYCLYREARPHHVLIHRTVWEAFVGPIPHKMQINHKNGNKRDNRLENLEVVTHSENCRHLYAVLKHTGRRGSANNLAALAERDIPIIRALYLGGKTQKQIAEQFGVSRSAISSVTRGRTWFHIPG